MQISSKYDAQKQIDQINAFHQEVKILEQSNILALTQNQQESVQTYHQGIMAQLVEQFDIDTSPKQKRLSTGLKVISFITALTLGASLFFLFYQFWKFMDSYTQTVLLIFASLITLTITYQSYQKDKSGYFTKIAALLTLVAFWVNVSMIGKLYNFDSSPNLFGLLSLFALLLAYATNTRLLLGFGIIFLSAFLSAQAGTWGGGYWIYFGERPENFFLPSLILFLIPYFKPHRYYDGFDPIYRIFAMILFFTSVLILSNFGAASYISYLSGGIIEGLYQLVGFGVSLMAIWFGIKKGWGDLINGGNIYFTLFLYTKFYDWWWDIMPKFIFFFLMGMVTLGLMLILKKMRHSIEESV